MGSIPVGDSEKLFFRVGFARFILIMLSSHILHYNIWFVCFIGVMTGHLAYNPGQKSWDTLVFSYTEVHLGNKTPNCKYNIIRFLL